MTEAKHTPGPWVADLHHIRISGGRAYAMVMGAGSIVPVAGALLGAEGCSDDEGRANARLIAAAPDMLTALKATIKQADEEVPLQNGSPYRTPECAATYDVCVAAIAKAEGAALKTAE